MPDNKFKVKFVLKENSGAPPGSFRADIIIYNKTAEELKSWKLCLDIYRPSEAQVKIAGNSIDQFQIIKNIAEYYEIRGLHPLPANGNVTIEISGDWIIKTITDTPSCYFLVKSDEICISASGTSDLSIITPPPRSLVEASITPLGDDLKHIRLIPAPSKTVFLDGEIDFSSISTIIDNSTSKESKNALITFFDNYEPLTNKKFSIEKNADYVDGSISLIVNTSLQIDNYILNINRSSVQIEANSGGGYLYGLISLFKLALSYNNKIPCVKIIDSPRFAYRGILLDVSRNFRTVPEIKKFLKMMASYKLNVFHCRMTDDEGWRLEIKKYPNITELGGFRGYGEVNPPFHGSGHQKYGGYYTQNEIRHIIDYANSLNITFIPEIVVPSHSRALIMSFTGYGKNKTNPLVEVTDKSIYSSAQSFTDNILNPALDFTYTVLDDIYRELISLFKVQQKRNMPFSDYIHIGVDEVPRGAWMKSPACKVLMEKHNLKTTEELQFFFINKIQKIVAKYGCKTAGWEEIVHGGLFLNKDIMVYSWLGQEAGFKAAEAGFPVVMTPAPYLYFDLAYTSDVYEPGLYWAGVAGPKKIYSYDPLPLNSSKNAEKNIKGIQACMWSETLGHPRLTNIDKLPDNYLDCPLEYMAFPKMTAYSEVAWSEMYNRNWNGFISKYSYEKIILDIFNIKYRKNSLE